MKPPFSHEDIEFLMPKLERIARELAFVPGSAEDLLQDTWLEALQSKPDTVRHPLAWMKVIMRRRSTKHRMAARLRKECEQLAARFEAESDEEAERASTSALVAAELNLLDAPYREILHLRFLEERSVREVAEQLGSSPETVRSQVHRGLARLRERLDRRAGSRDLWAGMLLNAVRVDPRTALIHDPVAEAVSELPDATQTGPQLAPEARGWLGIPSTGLSLAGAALILSGLAFWLWPPPPSPEAASPSTQSVTDAGEVQDVVSAEPGETDRIAAATHLDSETRAEPSAPPSSSAIPADMTRLALIIEDADGRPVPDAHVEVLGIGARALHDGTVGPDGRLTLDIGVDELIDEFSMMNSVTVAAWSDQLARPDILGVVLEAGRQRTLRVPLEYPRVSLSGKIVDPEGQPIPGASVEAQAAVIERRHFEDGVTRARHLVSGVTDGKGEFRLEGVVPKRLLVVTSGVGFVMLTTEITPQEGRVEVITLDRGAIVAGFVSYLDGQPASGARVWVGPPAARQRFLPETRADEDGFFLMGGVPDGEWEIFACDPGAPHLFAWTRIAAMSGEEVPFEAVLQPTSGVRLRVLDREGSPLAGAGVILSPAEPRSPWSALIPTDAAGRAQLLHVPDVPLEVRVYPNEVRGNGDRSAFRSGVRAGGAELTVQVESVAGEIEDRRGRVRGILLLPDGEPLAGAIVHAVPTDTAPPPISPAGGPLLNDSGIGISQVRTDGTFVIDNLSAGGHHLIALSRIPECAGVLDLGQWTVLSDEVLEMGTQTAPEGQPVRFTRTVHGDILLTAVVGPYWQPWMQTAGESLEMRILPGNYWVGTHGTGAYFDVPGPAVIPVPE